MGKTTRMSPLQNSGHMTDEQIRSEQLLVEQAKQDAGAFGILYDKYFEGIFQFIYRRTDDESTAGDITSQTFFKALKNLKRYEFRGLPFSAWLFRIASNEVNKYYYARNKKKVFSLEEERVKEIVEYESADFTQEQIDILISTLNELPTETMEVLELRFFEGKSFREISYILNIGESGAKMRLYRAVEKLRKQFNINWTDGQT